MISTKLLTVKEVAPMLRIAESTVRTWASEGKIRSLKLSYKGLRFKEKDIQDFIESKLVHQEAQHFNKPRRPRRSASANIIGLDRQMERYIKNAKTEFLGNA